MAEEQECCSPICPPARVWLMKMGHRKCLRVSRSLRTTRLSVSVTGSLLSSAQEEVQRRRDSLTLLDNSGWRWGQTAVWGHGNGGSVVTGAGKSPPTRVGSPIGRQAAGDAYGESVIRRARGRRTFQVRGQSRRKNPLRLNNWKALHSLGIGTPRETPRQVSERT